MHSIAFRTACTLVLGCAHCTQSPADVINIYLSLSRKANKARQVECAPSGFINPHTRALTPASPRRPPAAPLASFSCDLFALLLQLLCHIIYGIVNDI